MKTPCRTPKLTRTELTQAIRRYARKHNYYASTVRTVSTLFYAAIAEWRAR